MRWSLILSTFFAVQSALSFICAALVVPLPSDELEKRAPTDAKASSKTYRKNSQSHPYVYKFDKTGGVTREKLKPEDRLPNGKKLIMIPNTDADHVFELQMVYNRLKRNGIEFKNLDKDLKNKAKEIINGPGNVVPVPAGVNRAKGQLSKHGLAGKSIAPQKARDEYTLLSYGTAKKTAKSLDKLFKDHGYKFEKGKTFHKTLRDTMDNAKILKPGQPSPAASSRSSSRSTSLRRVPSVGVKGFPRRSARIHATKNQPKQKVTMPNRKSPRPAAKRPGQK